MKCSRCGATLQVGDYPFCKGSPEDHVKAGARNAAGFDPVVYFQGPGGKLAFPGRTNTKTPKGFKRVELTTFREVLQFEGRMNREERTKREREAEALGPPREQAYAEQRSHLRDLIVGRALVPIHDDDGKVIAHQPMSQRGKDLARAAIEYTERRKNCESEPTFHIEPFHWDASSRLPYRSEETGGRPRW